MATSEPDGADVVPIDGKRRCILCGRPARHRPVLLAVPSRDYTGAPWRFQLGCLVCPDHQKPLPDEILGMMDKLLQSNGQPKLWDHLVQQLKGRGLTAPHRASARVDYIEIDGEEALAHDRALAKVRTIGGIALPQTEAPESPKG